MPILPTDDTELWHRRLCHLNYGSMELLKSSLPAFRSNSPPLCDTCQLGKSIRKIPRQHVSRSKAILDLVHSDLSGKFSSPSIGNSNYYITFLDDYSRFCVIYFLRNKSDAFEAFTKFAALVERQKTTPIKRFRSDNGGEYINSHFNNYFMSHGIIHEKSIPYIHETNGVAERINRTLADMARCLLLDSKLPVKFWAEAIATAAYVKNLCPHAGVVTSPYEVWYGKSPSFNHLRIFGSTVYVHVPKEARPPGTKLSPRAWKGIFVGYTSTTNVYRIYNPLTNKIVESRDVVFHEYVQNTNDEDVPTDGLPIFQPSTVPKDEHESDHDEISSDDTSDHPVISDKEGNQPQDIQLRKSDRIKRKPSNWWGVSSTNEHAHFVTLYDEPDTYHEAMASNEATKWKKAMEEEISALDSNQTWTLVELPVGRLSIGCRWVYKIKQNSSGDIERFKARLVAKGFAQTLGVDYEETFAPVVKFDSLRILLSVAASRRYILHQMDVKSAFLHGELDEEVYMKQPEGFQDNTSRVCKLRKALYGLKQASRQWYTRINQFFIQNNSRKLSADHGIFYNSNLIVAIYVDDLIITGPTNESIQTFKMKLHEEFEMTDLGEAHWVLGLEVNHKSDGSLHLNQAAYATKILHKFQMENCNAIATPLDHNVKLVKDSGNDETLYCKEYQQLIGSLMYLMLGTRPDLAFAITFLSQFSSLPNKSHMQAAKRILRYLKGTSQFSPTFYPDKRLTVTGYVDASYANNLDDRRSYGGYIFKLGKSTISWCATKQKTVALSTTESEYMALSLAAKHGIWIKSFLGEIDVIPEVNLLGDNQASHFLAKNSGLHKRSKHIDIRYHFIREKLENKELQLEYCTTNDNLADITTKPLPKPKHDYIASKLLQNTS